jgi:hypothetical protein
MNTNIQQLADEAHEIIVNAKQAWERGEITVIQYHEIIKSLFEDVGYQTEVLSQPR